MSKAEDAVIDAAERRIAAAKAKALRFPRSGRLAIRAFCLECVGGSYAEVAACTCHDCPLYHMRPRKESDGAE